MTGRTQEHGTLSMRRHGVCKTNPCDACREAGNRYERRRGKMHTMGRPPLTAAEPCRRHVKELMRRGMTVIQIQNASGVNRTAIRVLLGEFPNRTASRRVRRATAAALLAVQLDRTSYAETGWVDSIGTRRRIRALVAIGYPKRELAVRLGNDYRLLQIAKTDKVMAATARAVKVLYEELRDSPGPSSRARTWALNRGYLPPVWWDDDVIDDPLQEPSGTREYDGKGRLVDDYTLGRIERTELMLSRGIPLEEIIERIGTPRRYIMRDLHDRRKEEVREH